MFIGTVDLSERLSVEPALIMFQKCSGVKFVWNQCLTVSSLEYGLKKSTLKKYSKYRSNKHVEI